MVKAIEDNHYDGVVENLGNTLEAPSLILVPEIQKIKDEFIELGFDGSLMSGSGSTIFALTRNCELIKEVMNDHDYDGWFRYKCRVLSN